MQFFQYQHITNYNAAQSCVLDIFMAEDESGKQNLRWSI